MYYFLRHHVAHHVGLGPHAFANLRLAGETCSNTDVDVGVFIGTDPRLALDGFLRQERAGLHAGMDLVAGAIKEAGVDEKYPVFYRTDTFFQVDTGAAFFVHHPDLDGVAFEAERVFNSIQRVVAELRFFRAVHFWFDDIDAAFTAVLDRAVAFQIVQCAQRGNHGIHQAFRNFVAFAIKNGIRGHQVADVAHQQ